ncbi:MAG: hypothetical protein ACYTGL_30580, partial [Planctomycetota bacterium]
MPPALRTLIGEQSVLARFSKNDSIKETAKKRPEPILFGTGFAHDLRSGLIQVIMADHCVGFISGQGSWEVG